MDSRLYISAKCNHTNNDDNNKVTFKSNNSKCNVYTRM